MTETLILTFTPAQRAALAPFVAAREEANAALLRVFTVLVIGMGVDPATHTATLAEDNRSVLVDEIEPPDDGHTAPEEPAP